MPTASTSQILGNNECFEPFTTNLGTRKTKAGIFIKFSKYLIQDLEELKLWTPSMKHKIMENQGSIQNIHAIPEKIRKLYKTVWEMDNRILIKMAADRGKYICQSMSLNVWMMEPTRQKLMNLHFTTWELGLKTGMYYLRTQAAIEAIKITVNQELVRSSLDSFSLSDFPQITPLVSPSSSSSSSSSSSPSPSPPLSIKTGMNWTTSPVDLKEKELSPPFSFERKKGNLSSVSTNSTSLISPASPTSTMPTTSTTFTTSTTSTTSTSTPPTAYSEEQLLTEFSSSDCTSCSS